MLLAAAVGATLAVAVAAASADPAPASLPDTPYSAQPASPDVAKKYWTWQGGAHFGDLRTPLGSPTPIEADLYAVRFWNPAHGYAAGAICKDPVPPGTTDVKGYLDTCERVPVIYRYSQPPGQPGEWTEVYRGTTKGYVGAIAFVSESRVLFVGG